MAQPMSSHGSGNSNFTWIERFERREPSVFVVAVSVVVTAIELIRICRTLHVHDLFIVGARLIDAEWAGVTSVICVRKVMALRVLDVEKSDVVGTLGCIYRSARREFGHSPPKRIVRAPRADVARWRTTIV